MSNLSIRTKLILSLSSVLVVSFLVTAIWNYMVTKELVHNNIFGETLPLISNNIFSDIQRDLAQQISISSMMANDTFLKDWAAEGEKELDRIERYLSEIKNRYNFHSTFFVSENTGNYYYYKGILKKISQDDSHDVWFYDFIKSGLDYALDVDTDEASKGALTIFINHRLEDDQGRLLGVAGIGIRIDNIGSILKSYQDRFDCLVYMVDEKGLVQVHANQEFIEKLNIADVEGMGRLAKKILEKKTGTNMFEFDRDNRHILVSARYFKGFKWFLIVEEDESASLGDVRGALVRSLAVGFVVTLFVIIVIVFTVNYYQRRLEILATMDDLTGIYNRRRFMEILENEAARAQRYKRQLCLLMVDADHFKSINDNWGHDAGDEALRLLARTMKNNLREVDIVGRLGGEEFAVILPETVKEKAADVAERIRAAVESEVLMTSCGPIKITVSVGGACSSEETINVEELLKQADQSMYRAKELGRNQVYFG